jgi:hypothetical protein
MKAAMFLLFIGLVDSVDHDIVAAEVTTSEYTQEIMYFPIQLFPCELEEGDMFYFSYVDGITEIRCGTPPD